MVSRFGNSAQDQALEDDLFGFDLVDEESPSANEAVPLVAAASAATVSDALLPAFAGPSWFYAVWKVGNKPTGLKVGVWCHKWTLLYELLGGRRLIGSGVQLKAFDEIESAVLYIQGRCSIKNGAEVEVFTDVDCEDAYRRCCM